MAQTRLDKFLTLCGVCSRSNAKNLIKSGKVRVNNEIIKSSDYKFDYNNCNVTIEGKEIKYIEYMYFMLNKPAGVISATEDKTSKTVIDLIDKGQHLNLFPVGRLDKDTEGLLLITNDGELSHNLLSPKKHVDKKYYVELNDNLTREMADLICNGITLDGEVTLPAKIDFTDDKSKVFITIQEGKYHQVKRMFAYVKLNVTYLKRISMGTLNLDESLKPGEYRELTEDEINILKASTKTRP